MLVDSNIFMYAAGAAHPHKAPAVEFLRRVAAGEVEAAIDAEVLQEILHRYLALGRWTDGQRVFALARGLFPEVLPVTGEILDSAKAIADGDATLSARDAVHAAVVRVHQLAGICSFHRDFDRIAGCVRMQP
jgi:predicted nucleic acid-binding protein